MSQTRLLSVLVENKPGVLMRVASMIRRRGFNIDSLAVGPTEDETVSRMTISVHVGRQQAEQATKQLAKIVDVIAIDDITGLRSVAHELLLMRVHTSPGRRTEIIDTVEIFRGRIVDVGASSLIVEISGSTEKIENFVELMRPYGIMEMARSGAVALVRGDQARIRIVDYEVGEEAVAGGSRRAPVAAGPAADLTGDI
ncbi:MAG: acetolactate synthase small subunit [Candidatus Dormibacteria bacterium]|jgi:acetolactate synthase-1/3 small subunit